jgi:hypothetical protein
MFFGDTTTDENVITVDSKYPAPDDLISMAMNDIAKAKAAGQHLLTLVTTNKLTSGGILLGVLGLVGLGYYLYKK